MTRTGFVGQTCAATPAGFVAATTAIEASGNRQLVEVAHRFLEKANRYRTLTTRRRMPPVYSNVNHAAAVEAIRRGDPQSAVEIHGAHKRRWMHELSDILSRLAPMDGAGRKH